MYPCEYPGCKHPGQKHHIVFRSQGGLDIPLNFRYLCVEHHTGKDGPHKNRSLDIKYKTEEQERLFELFAEDSYTMSQIVEIIGSDDDRIEKRFRKVPNRAGIYEREDIIRALMGGRIY
jgi:hypothetical protein